MVPPRRSMETQKILQELEALARTLDVRVTYEPIIGGAGTGFGGLCRVHGEWRLIVDRRLRVSERVQVIVDGLRRRSPAPEVVPPSLARYFATATAGAGSAGLE
jgi:hypothetical protein